MNPSKKQMRKGWRTLNLLKKSRLNLKLKELAFKKDTIQIKNKVLPAKPSLKWQKGHHYTKRFSKNKLNLNYVSMKSSSKLKFLHLSTSKTATRV